MNKTKKLHLNINGKAYRFFHELYLKYSMRRHGIKDYAVSYSHDTIIIELIGERQNLWSIINKHKRGNLLIRIHELTFHFEEVAVLAS